MKCQAMSLISGSGQVPKTSMGADGIEAFSLRVHLVMIYLHMLYNCKELDAGLAIGLAVGHWAGSWPSG